MKEDKKLSGIEQDIKETKNNIKHIKDYSIRYFEYLLKKFGKGKERRTEITSFDSISVRRVAVADQKLFFNNDGFIGTALKDGEYISYHLNGEINEFGLYINGYRAGLWNIFDQDGNKTFDKYYK